MAPRLGFIAARYAGTLARAGSVIVVKFERTRRQRAAFVILTLQYLSRVQPFRKSPGVLSGGFVDPATPVF
jgi:hypothetical protein